MNDNIAISDFVLKLIPKVRETGSDPLDGVGKARTSFLIWHPGRLAVVDELRSGELIHQREIAGREEVEGDTASQRTVYVSGCLCHRPVSLAALRLCYPCNAFVYEALAHVLRCSRRRQECATVAYLICAK